MSRDIEGVLVGRAAECEELDALLARARGGESAPLVIRGDPGVGKSALLAYVAARASGMTLLEVRGSEAESDIAFSGLFGLLRPVLDRLEQLPERQRRALSGAFGLGTSDRPDRFLVSAAALTLVALAAEEAPVVCLVDDVQWLDDPSAEAIVFVARRLRADRVALLATASEWEGRRFDARGLPELRLTGIDAKSAEAVLDQSAPGLAPVVRSRLLAEAVGNPLALRELANGLSEDERRGREPLPEQLPLTPRLRDHFERKVRRLPAAAATALLVCAVDGTADTSVIVRALIELGLTADALAPAEQGGLIQTVGSKIVVIHPLLRSAAAQIAPLAERQRVHHALAEALIGDEHVDRRVWHQAAAALSGDEEVASALELSAHRAQQRAGFASAASAFQRAAELSRDEGRRTRRLAAAADAAWNAGQIERAHALVDRILRLASGDEQRKLLQLRGSIEIAEGRHRDAAATLLAAAGQPGDPSTTLAILFDLVEPALISGAPQNFGIRAAIQARDLPAVTPNDAFRRTFLLWLQKRYEFDFEASRPFYDEAMRHADELADDAEVQYQAGLLTLMMFGVGNGLSRLSRAVELARRQGRIGLLPTFLLEQSFELSYNSQFERAYAVAGEGLQLAHDTGHSSAGHLVALARSEAVWGDVEAARRHLDEALARAGDNYLLAATAGAILGLLELSVGSPERAVDVMLRASPGERLAMAWTAAIPDLVEAFVRAGRPSRIEIDPFMARLRRSETTVRGNASLVARCEALLGCRPAEEAFARALELMDALSPFERARTELLYGEWLRRERQRKQARRHLRAAADEFRRLGAELWLARAETELRASGETARRREPSTLRDLTPQELQIAQLAAEGQSNPEIALQLYLSPRTVEYHLRKVFSKLGISGRTELVRHAGLRAIG